MNVTFSICNRITKNARRAEQSIKTLNFQEIKPAGSTLLFDKTNERIFGKEHFCLIFYCSPFKVFRRILQMDCCQLIDEIKIPAI